VLHTIWHILWSEEQPESISILKLESLLAVCLKSATTINVGIGGITLRENLEQIVTMLDIEDFRASNG
jgi:hypothetical protein